MLASVGLSILSIWGGMALWFQLPALRLPAVVAWGVGAIVTLVLWWRKRDERVALPWLAGMIALMAWWSTLQPTHNRVWADDVSRMVTGQVQGSVATLDQVRNFDWRSAVSYTHLTLPTTPYV